MKFQIHVWTSLYFLNAIMLHLCYLSYLKLFLGLLMEKSHEPGIAEEKIASLVKLKEMK